MIRFLIDIIGRLTGFVSGKPYARRSSGWAKLRAEVIAEHPYCDYCLCDDLRFLQVHHIEPFHLNPAREMDRDNLVVLCEMPGPGGCHLVRGHDGSWHRFNPNIKEDCRKNRERLKRILVSCE